jgi:hypothetical protein
MAGIGIQDLTSLFIRQRPGFVDTIKKNVMSYKLAVGQNYRWEGDHVLQKVKVGRHTGVTSGEDGMALPPGGKSTYIDSLTYRAFNSCHAEVTPGAMATAATSKDACISTVQDILDGLKDAISCYNDWYLFRDGTGHVANVVSHSGSTTLTVDDARGLWRDQWYTVRDSASSDAIVGTFKVSSVALTPTSGNAVVTITGAASATQFNSTDYDVYWGRGEWENYGLAPVGLDALIGTGTLQSITASNYPEWQSIVFTPSSGQQLLTPRLYRQMLASLYQRNGTKKVDLSVIGDTWIMVEHEELWQGESRMTPNAKIAGIVAPVYHSHFGRFMPMSAQQCPYGTLFFVDRREITRAVQQELDWFKTEGTGIFQRAEGSLTYFATMFEIFQNTIANRACCGKMDTLYSEKKIMF